jgi:NitT/TauT family transport system substrate-binding protein
MGKYWAFLLVALGVALVGRIASAETVTLTVAYSSANDYLPAFVAKEQGFFAQRGLDVVLTKTTSVTNVPPALVAKQVQIGPVTAPNLLAAAESGIDIVAISGATRSSRAHPIISALARTGAPIKAAADFSGKRVGVPAFGTVMDIVLRKWLKDKGADLGSVHFAETPFPQMPDLLSGGQVDAVAAIDPFRSRIIDGGIGYKVADYFSEVKDNVILAFWVSSRDWARQNPAAIAGFRAALGESLDWIGAHSAEAHAIEAKYLGVASPAFATYSLALQPVDLQFYEDLGKEQGLIHGEVDVANLIVK